MKKEKSCYTCKWLNADRGFCNSPERDRNKFSFSEISDSDIKPDAPNPICKHYEVQK